MRVTIAGVALTVMITAGKLLAAIAVVALIVQAVEKKKGDRNSYSITSGGKPAHPMTILQSESV